MQMLHAAFPVTLILFVHRQNSVQRAVGYYHQQLLYQNQLQHRQKANARYPPRKVYFGIFQFIRSGMLIEDSNIGYDRCLEAFKESVSKTVSGKFIPKFIFILIVSIYFIADVGTKSQFIDMEIIGSIQHKIGAAGADLGIGSRCNIRIGRINIKFTGGQFNTRPDP